MERRKSAGNLAVSVPRGKVEFRGNLRESVLILAVLYSQEQAGEIW